MTLPDRNLRLTAAAIVAALSGLIVVQVLLLMDAFALKQEAFRQNVAGALSAAAVRLATGETINIAFSVESAANTRENAGRGQQKALDGAAIPGPTIRVHSDSGFFRTRMMYRFETDSVRTIVRVEDGRPPAVSMVSGSGRAKEVFISRVIDNLWTSVRRPLEERISRGALDSALEKSLTEAGIGLEYASGVVEASDSVHLARPPSAAADLRGSPYQSALFLEDGPRYRIAVHFPGQQLYLLQQMWPVLLASGGFLVLIVAGFVAAFRTMMRQQALSRAMVEFINNMTHEFKTPLSTVTLATEAIGRPDVVGRRTKVLQYNRMIAEETLRMKGQVDRILNLAHLEEGDAELQKGAVEMHALLEEAIRVFAVQVESRGGAIHSDLRASRTEIRGDRVHLLNIVQSLLDNANKYSPGKPVLRVSTEDAAGGLVVSIADRGNGISEEYHERVFEKYFRVPTGDLHEVKGFGIGLSYVRRIMELHGGTVSLQSRPGSGTTVRLTFPSPSREVR